MKVDVAENRRDQGGRGGRGGGRGVFDSEYTDYSTVTYHYIPNSF